jgi:hypothetical protein
MQRFIHLFIFIVSIFEQARDRIKSLIREHRAVKDERVVKMLVSKG